MLHFHSLAIQGFRSFAKEQDFALNSAPGLVYITGENKVEPELGANGVGKSSLFESLFWCLYGKTSVNLRAGDVANWQNGTQCRVMLQFELNGVKHDLARTWSPNTLTVDGQEVTQEQVVELVGLSEDAFLRAIYHAQFVPHFADQTPAAQLEVFSDVLRLDVWDAAVETALREVKVTRDELHKVQLTAARAQATFRELDTQLDEQGEKELIWLRKHKLVQRIAKKAILQAERKREAAEARPIKDVAPTKAEEKEIADRKQKATECVQQLAGFNATVRVAQSALRKLTEGENELKDHDTCPLCLQSVKGKQAAIARQRHRAVYEQDVEIAEKKIAEAETEEQKLRKELADAEERVQARTRDAAIDNNNRAVAIREAEIELRELTRQMRDHARERCPFDTSELEVKRDKAYAILGAARANEQEHQEHIADCEFWATSFREIRLSLVRDALAQFELTTNSALSALGLAEWAVEYSVEAEARSGKTVKGFKVFIQSPYNERPVPFSVWSGGERQRLRLAITMGLSDLIQDVLGVHSNLEIYDEPTAWLSEEGVSGLLDMLDRRAADNTATILLADHRALDSSVASRVVKIIKSERGSVLEDM